MKIQNLNPTSTVTDGLEPQHTLDSRILTSDRWSSAHTTLFIHNLTRQLYKVL